MNKKTYLDYFLDNELQREAKEKKKRKNKHWRFNQYHEDAILLLNSGTLNAEETEKLWKEVVYPSLQVIVKGVMEMPKFHKLPHNLDRNQLIDDAVERLISKIGRFTPGLIGKQGKPVKAFSYFSTIAKNLILEKIYKANKIINNKADVETSIDLTILGEDVEQFFSNVNYISEDVESRLEGELLFIIRGIETILFEHNNIYSDFYKVGKTLVYILKNWHKIDFENKNDFMRILVLYTGLKQQNVSSIFKKYKNILIEKKIIQETSSFFESKTTKKIEEVEYEFEDEFEDESDDEAPFEFSSLEEFETFQQIKQNKIFKKEKGYGEIIYKDEVDEMEENEPQENEEYDEGVEENNFLNYNGLDELEDE